MATRLIYFFGFILIAIIGLISPVKALDIVMKAIGATGLTPEQWESAKEG